MPKIVVICDRCHKSIEGLESWDEQYTAGFYRRKVYSEVLNDMKDTLWAEYMKEGEDLLCDRCLKTDKQFKADHS